MSRRRVPLALAASVLGGCLLTAASARADVYDITGDTAAYGYDIVTLNDSHFTFPNSQGSVEVYSGADRISGTDVTSGVNGSWVAFCVDVHNYLTDVPYTFTSGPLSDSVTSSTKVAQISALIANGSALLASLGSGLYQGSYTATNVSSALQIAVWTAEYQTGTASYNATDSTRGFWVSSPSNAGDVTLANLFLADVTNGTWTGGAVMQFESLNPADNQNLATAVPEPASFALLGVGVAGLALRRRRRGG